MNKEDKRAIVLSVTPQAAAESLRVPLSITMKYWRRRGETETQIVARGEERLREFFDNLLPEHEDRVREILELTAWPEEMGRRPTFERLYGKTCPTCGGTGVAGYLFPIRCFDCGGKSTNA